jgi:murein DD-endopeptidase MepM/ murein hydrolase activator NlpD
VYNAHLDAIAAGLAPGDDVVSGQVLGTVGTTGNARYTPPHDHLGIARADAQVAQR